MRNLLIGLLLLFIITQGCNKSEIDELKSSLEYPFVYSELSQEEMATEIQNFNAIVHPLRDTHHTQSIISNPPIGCKTVEFFC